MEGIQGGLPVPKGRSSAWAPRGAVRMEEASMEEMRLGEERVLRAIFRNALRDLRIPPCIPSMTTAL